MMNRVEFTRLPTLDYACEEAINTLCTNLTFSGVNKRKILMTSCQASEGKSFLTINIMRTLARLGHSVALVDADLRRSQIAARYGMRVVEGSGQGMTHYLAGMCSLGEVVYQTNLPGTCFIPVGHEVSNSLALLSTSRLPHMLDQLREKFEFVLVDAPPVGVIIDAAEIAKFCDGAILGVKYNAISRKELVEAKSQLERSGCEILGAVLNSVAFDTLSSKKYYNKHYYSHYESDYYKPSQKGKKQSGTKKSTK